MNTQQAMTPPEPDRRSWLRTGHRLIFIALAVVLMGAAAYVLGTSWLASQTTAVAEPPADTGQPALAERQYVEAGSLYYLDEMAAYGSQQAVMDTLRTLEAYYARRAYNGAPPWIPHEVDDAMSVGGQDCLQCHETGGYVPPMEAYAPVAPHPELTSCTQCHVPTLADDLFAENEFEPAPPPPLPEGALEGAPPPVPHEIVPQMRENCAACHVGPAAPPEIRTDHLERDYCLQCHVPTRTDEEWLPKEEAAP